MRPIAEKVDVGSPTLDCGHLVTRPDRNGVPVLLGRHVAEQAIRMVHVIRPNVDSQRLTHRHAFFRKGAFPTGLDQVNMQGDLKPVLTRDVGRAGVPAGNGPRGLTGKRAAKSRGGTLSEAIGFVGGIDQSQVVTVYTTGLAVNVLDVLGFLARPEVNSGRDVARIPGENLRGARIAVIRRRETAGAVGSRMPDLVIGGLDGTLEGDALESVGP